jgi:hypothetical protein
MLQSQSSGRAEQRRVDSEYQLEKLFAPEAIFLEIDMK